MIMSLDISVEISDKIINENKRNYLIHLINSQVSYESPKIIYKRDSDFPGIETYFNNFKSNYSYYANNLSYDDGDISTYLTDLNSEIESFLREKDNVLSETEYIYLFSDTVELQYDFTQLKFTKKLMVTDIVESSYTYSDKDFENLITIIDSTTHNLFPIYYIYWVVVDEEDTNYDNVKIIYNNLIRRYEKISDFDKYRRINAVFYDETTGGYSTRARINEDDRKIINNIHNPAQLRQNLKNSRVYECLYNYIDEILPKSILKVGIDLNCYEQLKKNKLFNTYFLLQNIVNLSARDYKELDYNKVYFYDNINFQYTKFDNLIRAILHIQVSNNLDTFKDVFSVNELIDCSYYRIKVKIKDNEILYMCNRYKRSDNVYNDPDNDYLLKIFTNISKITDTTDITIPNFINNILQYDRRFIESDIVDKRIGYLYINTNLRFADRLIDVIQFEELNDGDVELYEVKKVKIYEKVDSLNDLLNSDNFKNIILDAPINNVYIKFKFIDNSLYDEDVEFNINYFKVFKNWYIDYIKSNVNTDVDYIKKFDEYILQDDIKYISSKYGIELVTFLHKLIYYNNNENVLELFNGIDHPENYTIYFPITSIVALIKYDVFNKHFMFLKIHKTTDSNDNENPLPQYLIPEYNDENIKKIKKFKESIQDIDSKYIINILILRVDNNLGHTIFDKLSSIIDSSNISTFIIQNNNEIYVANANISNFNQIDYNDVLVGFSDAILDLKNNSRNIKFNVIFYIGDEINNVNNLMEDNPMKYTKNVYHIMYDYTTYKMYDMKVYNDDVDYDFVFIVFDRINNISQLDFDTSTQDNGDTHIRDGTRNDNDTQNNNDAQKQDVALNESNSSNGFIHDVIFNQIDRFNEIDRILYTYEFVIVTIAGYTGDNLLVERYAKQDWDEIDKNNNVPVGSSYDIIKQNLDRLVKQLERKYGNRVKIGAVGFGKVDIMNNEGKHIFKDSSKDPSTKLLHIWGIDINNYDGTPESIINGSKQAKLFNIKHQIGVFGIIITPIKNIEAFKKLSIFPNYSTLYSTSYIVYNKSIIENRNIKDKVNNFNDAMLEIKKISTNKIPFIYYHINEEKNNDYNNYLIEIINNNNLSIVTWKVIEHRNRMNYNKKLKLNTNVHIPNTKNLTTMCYKDNTNIKIMFISNYDINMNLSDILNDYSILIIKSVHENKINMDMDINNIFYIHGKYSIYAKYDIIEKMNVITILNQTNKNDTIIHLLLNEPIQKKNNNERTGGGVVPKKSITNHYNELNVIIGKTPVDAIIFLIKKYKIPEGYRTNMNKLRSRLLTLNVKSKSGIRELLEGINTRELLKMMPGKLIVLEKHSNPRCKCNMCTPIRESQLENFAKIAQPIMEKNAKYYENVTRLYEKLLSELRYAKRIK